MIKDKIKKFIRYMTFLLTYTNYRLNLLILKLNYNILYQKAIIKH